MCMLLASYEGRCEYNDSAVLSFVRLGYSKRLLFIEVPIIKVLNGWDYTLVV